MALFASKAPGVLFAIGQGLQSKYAGPQTTCRETRLIINYRAPEEVEAFKGSMKVPGGDPSASRAPD
jgi:hypothetical protein